MRVNRILRSFFQNKNPNIFKTNFKPLPIQWFTKSETFLFVMLVVNLRGKMRALFDSFDKFLISFIRPKEFKIRDHNFQIINTCKILSYSLQHFPKYNNDF